MRISCRTDWAGPESRIDAVRCIGQAGYEGVDFAPAPPGLDAKTLLAVLADAGLVPAAVNVVLPADDRPEPMADVCAAAELAKGLGLASFVLDAGDRRLQSVEACAARIMSVLVRFSGLDLELVNRCGGRLEQPEDFRELFIHAPDSRLRVAVDTLEFHRASVDPCRAIDELADRIGRVILGDAVGRAHVPLGEGEVNIASVISRVRRSARPRWVSVRPAVSSRERALEELAAERRRVQDEWAKRGEQG